MNPLFTPQDAVNQRFLEFSDREIVIDIKREDLLHSEVSGNKLRKLKYNLLKAQEQGHDTLLTYGGAYSNHIAATAAAAQIMGFKSIGVIRGEELGEKLDKTLSENQTLRTAHGKGMEFHFISRSDYRKKDEVTQIQKLHEKYGKFYRIPEGGTNYLAVMGTEEILSTYDKSYYDIVAVAAGTGGTAAGIINSAAGNQKVVVFGALKGGFLKDGIKQFTGKNDFEFYDDEVFGGYAKSDDRLIDFMNARFRESLIPLEPIYTGKMMYRLQEMVEEGVIPRKTRILAVHTGGLQGIPNFNAQLAKKGRKTIDYEDQL
ncbi:MAG: pyridoxal-phosphate dependent enzyme [Nonlabens sp.]